MAQSFVKKPLEVEAIQFTGDSGGNCDEVVNFLGGYHNTNHNFKGNTFDGGFLKKDDLEFKPSDWIIKVGPEEFCVCSDEDFDKSYEIR